MNKITLKKGLPDSVIINNLTASNLKLLIEIDKEKDRVKKLEKKLEIANARIASKD